MKIHHFLISILITLTITTPIVSQEKASDFALNLFEQKDYYRAITEAKRYLFFSPTGSEVEAMEVLIGDAYIAGGDLKQGVVEYQEFIARHENSALTPEVEYKIAKAYISQQDYQNAATYFQHALIHPKVSTERSQKSKKWLSLILATQRPTDPEITTNGIDLDSELTTKLHTNFQKLTPKSPKTAGVLSAILPGAGQWYIGRTRDAKTAFILNGVFIWGAIEAFNQGNTGVGVMMTIFEAGWYSGNIYSAVSGAHKYNRAQKNSFILRRSIELGIYANQNDPILSIASCYRF